MKPLLRWTMGPTTSLGLVSLRQSIENITRLYPNQFDLAACYNQIHVNKLIHLKSFGVKFFNQHNYKELEYEPKGEIWKIYPPRLRPEAHELILDNDLIIIERVPEIELFLESDSTLLLEANRNSAPAYGKYAHLVPPPYNINTGLFGLPPNFDFKKAIQEITQNDIEKYWKQNRYTNELDDQGIISAILLNYEKFIIIKHPTIFNFNTLLGWQGQIKKEEIPKIKGIHFVGINVGIKTGWQKFWNLKLKSYL